MIPIIRLWNFYNRETVPTNEKLFFHHKVEALLQRLNQYQVDVVLPVGKHLTNNNNKKATKKATKKHQFSTKKKR